MMKIQMKLFSAACAVAFAMFAANSMAAVISINFTGMDLVYDGSSIYDAGGSAGGDLDPADADPLATVDFFVDGDPEGSLSGSIFLDVFIPDVTDIPSLPNTNYSQTTPGNPGYFDLLIGSSPLAAQYLAVDLSDVSITYLDVLGVVQFTFGAAIADNAGQNLPFGLVIGDPVTVSFSAQIQSKTSVADEITSFTAAGTGQIQGTQVPEPTAALLVVLGSLVTAAFARRRA